AAVLTKGAPGDARSCVNRDDLRCVRPLVEQERGGAAGRPCEARSRVTGISADCDIKLRFYDTVYLSRCNNSGFFFSNLHPQARQRRSRGCRYRPFGGRLDRPLVATITGPAERTSAR